MKTILPWLAAIALAGSAALSPAQTPGVPATLSAPAAEVVRLKQSGLADDVVTTYIQTVPDAFALDAPTTRYLTSVGITPALLQAMLNHDAALRAAAVTPVTSPAADPGAVDPAAAGDAYDSNPPPAVSYFYQDLAPQGAWLQLGGVGWCWQPHEAVSVPDWRPYCQGGHWVWTDSGWFWQSDYSWGGAVFHYGRWTRHATAGWVWTPDTVWGPAWVTWRLTDSECGWAPLPPRSEFDVASGFRFNGVRVAGSFDFGLRPDSFVFVGAGDLCQADLSLRLFAPADVIKVYGRSTVVNSYAVRGVMVNRGIPMDRVAELSHRAVPRVEIRDGPGGGRPGLVGGAAVYRQRLAPPSRSGPMLAQKVDERHPVRHDLVAPSVGRRPGTISEASVRPSPTPRGVAPVPNRGLDARPAPRFPEPSPVRVETPPQGRVTARGLEVFTREPGPSFAPPPTKPAPSAPTMGNRQYVPKTTRQESDLRPARASGAAPGPTVAAPAPRSHASAPAAAPTAAPASRVPAAAAPVATPASHAPAASLSRGSGAAAAPAATTPARGGASTNAQPSRTGASRGTGAAKEAASER